MNKIKGFTLLELLIVVIIIAVLAIIFIPAFKQAREAALNDEARANLKLIKAAEKAFHMQNGYYYSNDSETGINDNLKTSLQIGTASYPKRWNYTVFNITSGGGTSTENPFNISASRSFPVASEAITYDRVLWIDYLNDEPQCSGFCK